MGRNCDPNEPLCIPMGAETDPNTIRTVPHAPDVCGMLVMTRPGNVLFTAEIWAGGL